MSSLKALASVTSSDGPPIDMHCVRVGVWRQPTNTVRLQAKTRRMFLSSYYKTQCPVGSLVSGHRQAVFTRPGAIGPGVGTGQAGECANDQQLQLTTGPLLSQ